VEAFVLNHIQNSFLVVWSTNNHLVLFCHHCQHHSRLVFLHDRYCFLQLVLDVSLLAETVIQEKQLLLINIQFGCVCRSLLHYDIYV
jgi:hypothetical protein